MTYPIRAILTGLYFWFGVVFIPTANAQISRNISVEVSATVSRNPPSLQFNWLPDINATSYTVYKKEKSETVWGAPYLALAGNDSQFVDTAVVIGEAYEYRIFKIANGYQGNGYIYAGIDLPAKESRGKILLLVDSTYVEALAAPIRQLTWDLVGDGWTVSQFNIARTAEVTTVKTLIQNEYLANSTLNTVFLLGHIPVPYSGNFNPDAHSNHIGAWAADPFYADLDDDWTDISVSNTSASRTANHNIPGDGKYDQSTIPSAVELAVGRVDLINLPAIDANDTLLISRYLQKDHDYRFKILEASPRGLIDDNFQSFQEGFASNGWRNFATFFGHNQVSALDYFGTLAQDSYLWAYGCGGGSYTSAGGIGNTTQFGTDTVQAVFNMLFGSYFGDWDSDDNFLRAPLASQTHALTNAWAGRPHWYFHHMAMGDPIGYGAKISMNNTGTYLNGFSVRGVHMGLMGDPSLRLHVVAPPPTLNLTYTHPDQQVSLDWGSSSDTVLGYYVYRSQDSLSGYQRMHEDILTATSYTDSFPFIGPNYYMVRAVFLQSGSSGTYFNLSQGRFAAAFVDTPMIRTDATGQDSYCLETNVPVTFTVEGVAFNTDNTFLVHLSDTAGDFSNPQVIGTISGRYPATIDAYLPGYLSPGSGYRIRVVGTDPYVIGMDNNSNLTLQSCVGIEEIVASGGIKVYPVPSSGKLYLEHALEVNGRMSIYDISGKVIEQRLLTLDGGSPKVVDLSHLPAGVYLLEFTDEQGPHYSKILLHD